MSPPLRAKEHQEAIWQGIKDGTLQVIATDHCSFDFHGDKQNGKDDFTKCPNGAPGVETRMPIVFSEGVSKGRLSLNEFAADKYESGQNFWYVPKERCSGARQ